ncbi:MAG: imidazole glycerol phosphate synthase subunit HisH [Candidatus Omnitrophica bacterium]|nr:imidazole glycerol phosphate synthase subunit HisH [Candidatus Omnitrophota bacterium]
MIVVIDYGMGNLRSVSKALEHLGGKVKVSSKAEDIDKADKLVLPGVGAYGDAVGELRNLRLFDSIKAYLDSHRPFLGICLGLQLLFPRSDESPDTIGLGCLPGRVRKFKSPGIKIPHIGWNQVCIKQKHELLRGIPDESFFYFVHSYYAQPQDDAMIAGTSTYGAEVFAAIVAMDNLFATQFHPEKSQSMGLAILKNFLQW